MLQKNPQIGRIYKYDAQYREVVISVRQKRSLLALYKYYPKENSLVILAFKDAREENYSLIN